MVNFLEVRVRGSTVGDPRSEVRSLIPVTEGMAVAEAPGGGCRVSLDDSRDVFEVWDSFDELAARLGARREGVEPLRDRPGAVCACGRAGEPEPGTLLPPAGTRRGPRGPGR